MSGTEHGASTSASRSIVATQQAPTRDSAKLTAEEIEELSRVSDSLAQKTNEAGLSDSNTKTTRSAKDLPPSLKKSSLAQTQSSAGYTISVSSSSQKFGTDIQTYSNNTDALRSGTNADGTRQQASATLNNRPSQNPSASVVASTKDGSIEIQNSGTLQSQERQGTHRGSKGPSFNKTSGVDSKPSGMGTSMQSATHASQSGGQMDYENLGQGAARQSASVMDSQMAGPDGKMNPDSTTLDSQNAGNTDYDNLGQGATRQSASVMDSQMAGPYGKFDPDAKTHESQTEGKSDDDNLGAGGRKKSASVMDSQMAGPYGSLSPDASNKKETKQTDDMMYGAIIDNKFSDVNDEHYYYYGTEGERQEAAKQSDTSTKTSAENLRGVSGVTYDQRQSSMNDRPTSKMQNDSGMVEDSNPSFNNEDHTNGKPSGMPSTHEPEPTGTVGGQKSTMSESVVSSGLVTDASRRPSDLSGAPESVSVVRSRAFSGASGYSGAEKGNKLSDIRSEPVENDFTVNDSIHGSKIERAENRDLAAEPEAEAMRGGATLAPSGMVMNNSTTGDTNLLPAGDLRPDGTFNMNRMSRGSTMRPSMIEGNARGSYFQGDVDPNEKPSFGPMRAPIPADDVSDIIDVKRVQKAHHTDEYDEKFLIVRRGFWVPLIVEDFHALSLFKNRNHNARRIAEDVPSKAQREIHLNVDDRGSKHGDWALDAEGKRFKVDHNAIVGEWRFFVNRKGPYRLFIVFNPWCEQDQVFMEDEEQREQFVLEEGGFVYQGKSKTSWFFGQFESGILETTLNLLDRTPITASGKASVINVSRALSAAINSSDKDRGLLLGRWAKTREEYYDRPGSKEPSWWTSSVDLFQRFAKTGKPVRYGQCWVFGACLNTALRCLGIPSRVVTCVGCAHDNNENLVYDYYLDENYREVDSRGIKSEKKWNYHVWNEAWMRRKDLGEAYDGWQALDSTPQERSDKMYQCGPSSIKAIKEGNCFLPYDAGFVFAEMNADFAYWVQDKTGKFKLWKLRNSTGVFGIHLLTDNNGHTLDLRDQYKYEEGSVEERRQTFLAVSHGTRPNIYDEVPTKDSIEISANFPEFYVATSDFRFAIGFQFKEGQDPSGEIVASLTGNVITYNGAVVKNIFEGQKELKLPEEKTFEGIIEARDLVQYHDGEYLIQFNVFCHIPRLRDMTGEVFEVPFDSARPHIELLSSPPFLKGKSIEMIIAYNNEFDFPLTKGKFKLEAPWLKENKPFALRNPIRARDRAHIRVQYTPRKRGILVIVGSFMCEELKVKSTNVKITVE